jgi:N-hydroxyarylamine O-acetyltransferase
MSHFNALFRNRIGFSAHEVITFENLHQVLEKIAKTIPFENMCIMEKKTLEISKENLTKKILEQNEGGLCYELNTILYLFLIENGFSTTQIRGATYDQNNQRWSPVGKTHVFNLVQHNDQLFIVDTGFGGNLPLKPVPLNGEIVSSQNGDFRVVQEESEHGDLIFYMKLKHKDQEWKKGYAFDSTTRIKEISEINEVQQTIVDHPASPFNKKPIITKITDKGNITLTETTYTQWKDGTIEKEDINEKRFKQIAKENFGL